MNDQRGFQLYLMSLMRGQSKIGAALRSLGISAKWMREAAAGVERKAGFLDLTPREIDAYEQIIGASIETIPEPGEPFGGSLRHRFHLSQWRDFDLILRTHRAGWVWGPEFVRRSAVSVPEVGSVRELIPWTILESEVVTRFGAFASEDAWNLGKDATYVIEEAGESVEITLAFDLALLQSVHAVSTRGSHVANGFLHVSDLQSRSKRF